MSKTHAVTSVHVDYVEYCLITMVSMLSLSNNAYNVLKSLGYLHIKIIQVLQSLNHIQLTLFMFITLSIALLIGLFLCFHCLTKTVICLNP